MNILYKCPDKPISKYCISIDNGLHLNMPRGLYFDVEFPYITPGCNKVNY